MSRIDPHSFADDAQPRTRHLRWKMDVDFASNRIDGEVTFDLAASGSGPFDLDTKGLEILGATVDGKSIPHELAPEVEILGRRLRLELPAGTSAVTVRYRTSPDAIGLQWLVPEQTEGKKHPFLFSQCQAIHARTMVPVQDTPAFRVSYSAEVVIPAPLSAVMSAGPAGDGPGPRPGTRSFRFEMPQPIPPYLVALAVGELESRDLSHRSRVWAEPATIEKAAWEFAGIEKMMTLAEGIFGPYEWDRYDMLVLPPSFPYGGMENPRMTFLTPTLLAGDRSLVDVVAHELAHSWTGNLVTNATMEHFWLNEGWTVWAERRITEALHGADEISLQWAIGGKDLEEAIGRFGPDSPLTKLRQHLDGVDPDDAFSTVPYEKGSRLLTLLERHVGRERFDRFVRDYISTFRFTSTTTERFMAFLEEKLPGAAKAVDADRWLNEPGLPPGTPVFRSEALERITGLAAAWGEGKRPDVAAMKGWKPAELVLFLQSLPRPLPVTDCDWLETSLGLSARGNYEILVEWLTIAAASDYAPAFPRIREVLTRVGRMKYLRPLYNALGRTPRTRALAREIFAAAAPTYHSLSRRVTEGILAKYAA